MHRQENHFKASFFKTTTMVIMFYNAVSFCNPIVHQSPIEKEAKHEPSFSMQRIGYTPLVESINAPTFSVLNNPIKELTPMGVRERITIPFRNEEVATPNRISETEVFNFGYENPSVSIERERIKIPFRMEKNNSPMGSEYI